MVLNDDTYSNIQSTGYTLILYPKIFYSFTITERSVAIGSGIIAIHQKSSIALVSFHLSYKKVIPMSFHINTKHELEYQTYINIFQELSNLLFKTKVRST